MSSATPAEYVPAGRVLCLPESINGATLGLEFVGAVVAEAQATPRKTAVEVIPALRTIRNILLRYNILTSE
jgi:hypothetical protein